MARPIWKGHISFGLVQIPVALHSAEIRTDLSFRLLDSRDHARIRYERVNESTGQEVPWNDVVKAFEYDDNNYVVLSDQDFKRAAVEATQTIEIEDFVDRDDIDLMYVDKPYYLVPGKHGEKGYVLLRDALEKSAKAGIARVVIRTREHLAALLVKGRAMVLMLLRFHQELADPSKLELPPASTSKSGAASRELEMALKLIESMSGVWQPRKYHDKYRESLMKWIQKKARMGKMAQAPEAEPEADEPTPAILKIGDLLEQSLKARPKRGASARPSGRSTARPAARRQRKAAG